jgi:hypothetical protein
MSFARIFNCALCHRQVVICSCCDRGNIYCGPECSQIARGESLRAAGERYQNTHRGKINHAKRQKCYRERQRNKVTHQCSPVIKNNVLLPFEDYKSKLLDKNEDIYCHFCGCKCDSLLRVNFLKTQASSFWPLGP